MKSEFSSPAQKQESSPEGRLELKYNTQMINNQNVPKLRFKEFSGEWEEKKLGEVAEKIGDGLHGTPLYSDNSDIYFINGNNLTNGKIEINENTKKVDHEIFKKNDKSLNNNTLLISLNGTIGNIAKYNNEKVMLSKSVGYFNFKENTDFYYHVLNTKTIQNFFISELTGSTIKNLSLKTLRETEISFPSLLEQQKIATFLSSVDTKIDQFTRKKELFEQYKKGVMQKIFSQELRFKADDGSEFPEWEEKTLGEISVPKQWATISSNDLLESGYSAYGANSFIGYYSEYNHENETVTVTCRGATCGTVSLIPEKSYITGNSMCLDDIESSKYNYKFIYYAISFRGFQDIISGSAQPQIVGSAIKKVKINIPCLEEQTKIANFLSAIDTKIDHVAKQLDEAKNFKKGLLQQMFV